MNPHDLLKFLNTIYCFTSESNPIKPVIKQKIDELKRVVFQ